MDAIDQNHGVLYSTWLNNLFNHNSQFKGTFIAIAKYSMQLQGTTCWVILCIRSEKKKQSSSGCVDFGTMSGNLLMCPMTGRMEPLYVFPKKATWAIVTIGEELFVINTRKRCTARWFWTICMTWLMFNFMRSRLDLNPSSHAQNRFSP